MARPLAVRTDSAAGVRAQHRSAALVLVDQEPGSAQGEQRGRDIDVGEPGERHEFLVAVRPRTMPPDHRKESAAELEFAALPGELFQPGEQRVEGRRVLGGSRGLLAAWLPRRQKRAEHLFELSQGRRDDGVPGQWARVETRWEGRLGPRGCLASHPSPR